jgi:hypothetical protein
MSGFYAVGHASGYALQRDSLLPWRIAGDYFESCNCDAICPCRQIGGRPGGRSTHGICLGVLAWAVVSGQAGEIDLSGLNAAFTIRYDDDEPGSPWSLTVHVDERGDERQREALARILVGDLGGPHVLELPWVRKPSELLSVSAGAIEITNTRSGHAVRVGTEIDLAASRPVTTEETVTCLMPGHDRPGTELYADRLAIADGPFELELAGNCAFFVAFDYRSD